MIHRGEPIRLMSGEHGTVVVGDGEELPAWAVPSPDAAPPDEFELFTDPEPERGLDLLPVPAEALDLGWVWGPEAIEPADDTTEPERGTLVPAEDELTDPVEEQ